MAKLVFKAEDLKRVVEHSMVAPEQRKKWTGMKDGKEVYEDMTEPSFILVHDQGVYIMSNGTPGDPLDPKTGGEKYFKHYVAYAAGCHPDKDDDWYETARDLVGGDDFAETVPWVRNAKSLIDSGYDTIIINFGARHMTMKGGKLPTRRAAK